MRKKHLNQWIMYHEVHKQHRDGLKPAQISRELVIDRRTVKKYLKSKHSACCNREAKMQ